MRVPMMMVAMMMMACGDDDPQAVSNACPAGTTAVTWNTRMYPDGTYERHCEQPGGRWHGPLVSIDREGHERLRGQMVNGEREGPWLGALGDFDSYGEYHHSLNDGLLRLSAGDFTVEHYFKAGTLDGLSIEWDHQRLRVLRYFHDGHRVGTWRRFRHGVLTETRQYGYPDTLVIANGRVLPPPLAEIELPDGEVVVRRTCTPRPGLDGLYSACFALFEAYQQCGQDPACRAAANADYRHPRDPW